MWPNPQFPANSITFTEEILNEKLHFLCSESFANFVKEIFVSLTNFIENPIIHGNSPNEVRFPLVVPNFKNENNFDKINLSLLKHLCQNFMKNYIINN